MMFFLSMFNLGVFTEIAQGIMSLFMKCLSLKALYRFLKVPLMTQILQIEQ